MIFVVNMTRLHGLYTTVQLVNW